MFDGIMLSGDDYIAHYLILIKPAKNDIVEGRERMFHDLHAPIYTPHPLAATSHF